MSITRIAVLGARGFPGVQGGVEKHCEKLYPLLARSGCEVTVFTRKPYIPEENRTEKWNGVGLVHLGCPRNKFLEAIVHTFFGILKARSLSVDILHIHAIGPSFLAPFAKALGMKAIITHHGFDYERKKWALPAKWALRAGEFMGVKFADKVIVVSGYIKDRVEKEHERKDLVTIPNGIEIPAVSGPGENLHKHGLETKKYLFAACRIVPEKGLHDLIEAYKLIEQPAFKLVIAGDADHETGYSRRLKRKAKECGVIMTGFISGDALRELYSNAGLFVLPSYHEGLPIGLLEALSYGLPVLVSDIPQNRVMALPEYRYFKVGDVEALAGKIGELFKKGISEEEKNKQIELLRREHDWGNIARRTMGVYESVVKR